MERHERRHSSNVGGMRRGPGMGGPTQKAKDFKGSWNKLLRFNPKLLPLLILALLFSIVSTVLTLMGPDKISDLTEAISSGLVTGIDLDKVTKIGILLTSFYVMSTILSIAQGFTMSTFTQNLSKQLRESISKKINKLPMSYYNNTTSGDILSRVTNDIDTIGHSLNMSVGNLVSAITLFFGSLILMLFTNVIMTVTVVGATIIGFGLMGLIMSKSQKFFIKQQKNLGDINGHIEEIYSGHLIVKAYNAEDKALEKFDGLNNELRDSGFKAQVFSGLMMPLMGFLGNFGYVAVCVVGAILTIKGKIGFEVIIAFMMYVRYFTQPLSQIAQANQALQSAAAAGERVFEFLEAKEMEDESHKTKKFENVKFGYDPDKIIIKNFNAVAKPGQKIAIVGPTGAGKTTIVNLLMRFFEINSGVIKIDGIPTTEVSREEVHAQFCMVLQDTWLFEGTIRENLIYCTPNVTDEEMRKACRAVGIDHFIRTLPHGYDSVLNDQLNLSQGQRQQLTIARAMIANKPMLILDEATSSVDTRIELKIQEAMDQLMKNRTSFVIAHRLSTIKNADMILVMKDGDIIESGKHDELLEKKGFYSELYNSQFEDIREEAE